MKKPRVEFNSSGESGNTLYILCLVRKAMQKQRRYTEYNDLRDAVLKSHSYAEALELMRGKADLVDLDGKF